MLTLFPEGHFHYRTCLALVFTFTFACFGVGKVQRPDNMATAGVRTVTTVAASYSITNVTASYSWGTCHREKLNIFQNTTASKFWSRYPNPWQMAPVWVLHSTALSDSTVRRDLDYKQVSKCFPPKSNGEDRKKSNVG